MFQVSKLGIDTILVIYSIVDDGFREVADSYLRRGLNKGIPSLFTDIKSLYPNPVKRDVIEDIVTNISETSPSEADPAVHLWSLYFLAQHHSCLGRQERALELIDQALAHTPTLPDLFTCKARILKRAGDLLGAADALNDARVLDLQDRFLNTKCAKYRLRAGLIDEANEVLGLFTKVCCWPIHKGDFD